MKAELYSVKVQFYHESFGGYDHKDECKTYKVKASTCDIAEKRARKLANKDLHIGWFQVVSILVA